MTALRYARNKSHAEDVFQEGLIQIFKDLHQFDDTKSSFPTWSNRVLINAALRFIKKNNKLSFDDLDDHMDLNSVPEKIHSQLATKELTEMVQRLPDGYRIVFNLYVIEGYSHKEIAAQLQVSVNTSKTQLFKAKKELRLKLESHLTNYSNE